MKKLMIENFGVIELKIKEQKLIQGGGFGPFNIGLNWGLRIGGATWNTHKFKEITYLI